MTEGPLHIRLNGEPKEVAEGTTLEQLVTQLDLVPARLAVELNFEVVRRADWPTIFLTEGDRLEVVHFVGGGHV